MSIETAPFPLEGGRAGDGGANPALSGNPAATPVRKIPGKGIARARRLRREATLAERALWTELRARKLNIRRQVPIGTYTVDFASLAHRLVIEVDGYYHTLPENIERDGQRTRWLEAEGYRVIRFSEKAAREDLYSVADKIEAEMAAMTPSPRPPRGDRVRAIASGVQSASPPPTLTLPPSRGKGTEVNPSIEFACPGAAPFPLEGGRAGDGGVNPALSGNRASPSVAPDQTLAPVRGR